MTKFHEETLFYRFFNLLRFVFQGKTKYSAVVIMILVILHGNVPLGDLHVSMGITSYRNPSKSSENHRKQCIILTIQAILSPPAGPFGAAEEQLNSCLSVRP